MDMRLIRGDVAVFSPEQESALDLLPMGILVVDADSRLRAANRAWTDLAGLSRSNSGADGWLAALRPADHDRLRDTIRLVADGAGEASDEYEMMTGSERRWSRWLLRRSDHAGDAVVVMAVLDVDAEHFRHAEAVHRATHDSLTGLVNRAEFFALVEQALSRRERRSGLLAVAFVDLDGFKAVNDANGHLLGDRLLAAVAHRIRRSVRPGDVVARVGGDEFAVFCEDFVDHPRAGDLSRRIRGAFAEPFSLAESRVHLGASVGIATADGPTTPEALLDAADHAMYEEKSDRHVAIKFDRLVAAAGAAGPHHNGARPPAGREPDGEAPPIGGAAAR